MEIAASVRLRRRAGRKILFTRDSACLEGLLPELTASNHRTLVLWSLDMAEGAVRAIEAQCPDETRPREALCACAAWARGEVKMPLARPMILAVHAAAKETSDAHLIALLHAVGQVLSTVHAKTHAPGFAFYDLTALALAQPPERLEEAVLKRIGFYQERLEFWRRHADDPGRKWAGFLTDSESENHCINLHKP